MLSVRGLRKSYPGGVVGLHPIDLELAAGERLAVLGPTGSGKSTLLRLILGLEEADGGEVWVNGERVDRLPPHRRGVALLPQRVVLYPQLTVRGNLDSVPSPGTAVPGLSDSLSLDHLLPRYPHQLSGGERQRVALAKLLRLNRPVWLLDEPFSGLDPMFRSEFRTDLHLFLATTGATIVLVTHDPIDALALGHRIGVLADGKVQQVGTPDELRSHPGNRFVAFCVGNLSLIDGTVDRAGVGDGDPAAPGTAMFVSEGGSVRVPVPQQVLRRLANREPTPRLTLGLRLDDLEPRSPGDSPHGTITGWPLVSAEPDGSGRLLTVARGRSRVRVRWQSGSPPPVGARTDWTIPADRGTWFDGATGERL
jgi:ABC-type sugar transport system ATPase subunit